MSIFSFIGRLLKGIVKFIRKNWILVLLVVAACFIPGAGALLASAWSSVGTFAAANGWLATAAIGFGLLAAVAPGVASEIVENVGEVAGDAAVVVGEVVGEVVGAATGALSGTAFPLLAIGALVFFATRKSEPEVVRLPPPASEDSLLEPEPLP